MPEAGKRTNLKPEIRNSRTLHRMRPIRIRCRGVSGRVLAVAMMQLTNPRIFGTHPVRSGYKHCAIESTVVFAGRVPGCGGGDDAGRIKRAHLAIRLPYHNEPLLLSNLLLNHVHTVESGMVQNTGECLMAAVAMMNAVLETPNEPLAPPIVSHRPSYSTTYESSSLLFNHRSSHENAAESGMLQNTDGVTIVMRAVCSWPVARNVSQ